MVESRERERNRDTRTRTRTKTMVEKSQQRKKTQPPETSDRREQQKCHATVVASHVNRAENDKKKIDLEREGLRSHDS